jgi:hypothetical protein
MDYLIGRSNNPRYEDFVNNAETELLNEAEEFMQLGINAEVNSTNELIGSVGTLMKNFYTSHKEKYNSPLARLRLIFGTRELANKHLNPKTIEVYSKTPFWSNLVEFLKGRGILPQKAIDNDTEFNNISKFRTALIEELNKLEEEYISSIPPSVSTDFCKSCKKQLP